MMPPNTLVTGASGFIGRHLVDRLLGADRPVSVLARPGSLLPERVRNRIKLIECADWSEAGLRQAIDRDDIAVIFHLAAYGTNPAHRDVDQARHINVDAPAALVRFCKERGARLVIAGTFSEYQAPARRVPLTEIAPLETTKIYGASKAAGGRVASELAAGLGVRLRILRLFHVYGQGEAAHRLLPSLVSGRSEGRRVPLSPGTQVRDFIYVADVVEAFLQADADMELDGQPLTWNVCTGVGHSIREFALTVADLMGARRELLGFGDLELRKDDLPWIVGNAERISAALGWKPQHDLTSGLQAAVTSIMANERLSA